MKKRNAFTLAEVLITLGIIGIVAAMTMPTLITDARKKTTATKVKKFYNMMNNAVQFSIAKNGDVENWMGEARDYTYEENAQFVKDYFLPYIKYRKYEKCSDTNKAVCVYLIPDGMFVFRYDLNGGDIAYLIDGKYLLDEERTTHNYFGFQFNKRNGDNEDGTPIERDFNRKTSVEPYTYNWDGTYENLKTHPRYGCNKNSTQAKKSFCTKLLQMNNWEITDDYPW